MIQKTVCNLDVILGFLLFFFNLTPIPYSQAASRQPPESHSLFSYFPYLFGGTEKGWSLLVFLIVHFILFFLVILPVPFPPPPTHPSLPPTITPLLSTSISYFPFLLDPSIPPTYPPPAVCLLSICMCISVLFVSSAW